MYRLLAIRMATQQEYEDILLYKTAASNAGQKKYRDGLSTNDKRSIRDKAQRYALQQQCLYLPEKDSTGIHRMRRVVVKQEEKSRILNMCHDGLDGMHFGRDKTYGKVYLSSYLIKYNYICFMHVGCSGFLLERPIC